MSESGNKTYTARAPLRVSFLGGGSDIPWFYENYGPGSVTSIAINKYVYVSIKKIERTANNYIEINEIPQKVDSNTHPIVYKILGEYGLSGILVSVKSDIPGGSGLGGSSAFTVALLAAINSYLGLPVIPKKLAEAAFIVEHKLSDGAVGKQDQYASAIGGFNTINFKSDGSVEVVPIKISKKDLEYLRSSLYLVPSGNKPRSATKMLKNLRRKIQYDKTKIYSLKSISKISRSFVELYSYFGINILFQLIGESWELKVLSWPKNLMSPAVGLVKRGLIAGAAAGKLLGAGGSGYVLFIVPPDKFNLFSRIIDEPIIKIDIDWNGVAAGEFMLRINT